MQDLSKITNDPYAHLRTVAAEMDKYDTRPKIDSVLDELEFIHELLDPAEQPMVTQLTAILMERYRALG
jgi:hypothetical protein